MNRRTSPRSWTLNQGLAAQYAAQAGIDPDLAAAAGKTAWDVLKALGEVADEPDPKRRTKRAAKVLRLLGKIGPGEYADLREAIQSRLRDMVREEGPSINPETGLQEFAVPPAVPVRESGPTSSAYWKQSWADNPNDESVGQMALRAAMEADARKDYTTMEAIAGALEDRYLPNQTSMREPPQPYELNYDQRLNEYGLQWGVDPKDLNHLVPAGEAEQTHWQYNRDKEFAPNTLLERGMAVGLDGTVGLQPDAPHPNPISDVLSNIRFGIARRKREDMWPNGALPWP